MEKHSIEELLHLLAQDIPPKKAPKFGFLELISKSHDETIISKIYEFFLDNNNDERLANAFLDALLKLIEGKGKSIEIKGQRVSTEITTEAKNRIDIVVEGNDSVIIIENKIYHYLDNPLDDYWNHYDVRAFNQKVGIVLTLESQTIPREHAENYINIRHIDWINEVKNGGLPPDIDPKIYIYLNDFFNTIESLTKYTEMNERAKFYLKNAKKAYDIACTGDDARLYISNQLKIVAERYELSLWSTRSNEGWYRAIWKPNHPIFIGILYNKLIEGEKYFIIKLETNKGPELAHRIQGHLKSTNYYEKEELKDAEIVPVGKGKELAIYFRKLHIDNNNLGKLADTIYEFIQVEVDILNELMDKFPE